MICRDLNARGIPTTGKHPWLSSNLDQILTSPRIAGWRQKPLRRPSRGPREFLARAQWPAIVTRRNVEQAQALMSEPTRRPGSTYTRLLTGIAVCAICGQPLRLVQHAGKPPRYAYQPGSNPTDNRCGHVSITADYLDQHVLERLSDAVTRGLIGRPLIKPPGPAGKSNPDTQSEVSAELRRFAVAVETAGSVPRAFAAASVRARRAWITSLTSNVVVSAASRRTPRPDPDSIQISWSA